MVTNEPNPRGRKRPTTTLRRLRRAWRNFRRDTRGTTSLEWALLLGAIALPSIILLTMCLGLMLDYYRMMTMIGSMP